MDRFPQLSSYSVQNKLGFHKICGSRRCDKYFFEMIEICNKYGVFVETVTNGSLLNNENIKQLKYVDHEMVWIP